MSFTVVRHNRPNRSATHGVMENSGFGALTIYRKDGAIIDVPQKLINSSGYVKSGLVKDLHELTKENAMSLAKRGVKIYIGKAELQ